MYTAYVNTAKVKAGSSSETFHLSNTITRILKINFKKIFLIVQFLDFSQNLQ